MAGKINEALTRPRQRAPHRPRGAASESTHRMRPNRNAARAIVSLVTLFIIMGALTVLQASHFLALPAVAGWHTLRVAYPRVAPTQRQPTAAASVRHAQLRQGGNGRVLFRVLITHKGIVEYMHAHSREWLTQVHHVGDLMFSVGRPDNHTGAEIVKWVRDSFPRILIQELDVPDDEYPPVRKTLQGLEHLGDPTGAFAGYDFVANMDSDTHFHPLRVAALLLSRPATQPLYMGRPLVSCCRVQGAPTPCPVPAETSYCGGSGYGLSRATLQSMRGEWSNCWDAHSSDFYHGLCRSSDVFVGLCLNAYANTTCTSASASRELVQAMTSSHSSTIAKYMADYLNRASAAGQHPQAASTPTHGAAWGRFRPDGNQLRSHTLFCQDTTHSGGIGQRFHIPLTYAFTASDRSLCALMHPLKVGASLCPAHVRYTRYLMGEGIEIPLWAAGSVSQPLRSTESLGADLHGSAADRDAVLTTRDDHFLAARPRIPRAVEQILEAASRCRVAVNVHSTVGHAALRKVVRSTWGRVALALLGVVQVRFLIDARTSPLLPHERQALDVENRTVGDLVVLDTPSCPQCEHSQSLASYDWAAKNTNCHYIMKVDDDVYVRAVPLLAYLARFGPGAVDNVYFSMTFGEWSNNKTAKIDPAIKEEAQRRPVFELYEHEYLPPIVSGDAVGLSRNLVERVLAEARERVSSTLVNASPVAMLQSDDVHNASSAPLRISGPGSEYMQTQHTCTPHSIWDALDVSYPLSFYERYVDDLNGRFCARAAHTSLPRGRPRHQ